MGLKCDNNS